MKKILLAIFPLVLAGCASSGIDIVDRNNFGVKCSENATTPPNWQMCMKSAQATCGSQAVVNASQHAPTGSGNTDDAYFMTFQCN
ncbi:hypothetical protein ACM5Q9_02160 [Advenella sp. RU8]|uniref:hypothetical protein n=1 Tax=Advenella sp. RU8 TaxID=3399575 RepID=UPI003AB0F210